MFTTICAIVGSIGMMFFVLIVSKLFDTEKEVTIVRTLVFGLGTFFCTQFSVETSPLVAVVIILPIIIAMMGYLIWWWAEDGSTIKEMIFFIVMELCLNFIGNGAAGRITAMTSARWIVGIIRSIPDIMFIMSFGFFIANRVWFRMKLEGGEEYEE